MTNQLVIITQRSGSRLGQDEFPVLEAIEGQYGLRGRAVGEVGDSGGPVFAKIGGKWTVIGLTSHGSEISDYADVSFNTRVSVHAEWICSISSTYKPISGC